MMAVWLLLAAVGAPFLLVLGPMSVAYLFPLDGIAMAMGMSVGLVVFVSTYAVFDGAQRMIGTSSSGVLEAAIGLTFGLAAAGTAALGRKHGRWVRAQRADAACTEDPV